MKDCILESSRGGFESQRSLKRLNETALDSYQFIDKIDMKTMQRAEKHATRVNSHLGKIKKDMIKSHLNQFK